MGAFPGAEFYDTSLAAFNPVIGYYELVTTTCRWPGCGWEQTTSWDEKMAEPFVEHFKACHDGQEVPS